MGGPIHQLVEPEEVSDTPFAVSLGPPIAVLVFRDERGASKRLRFIEQLPRPGRLIRHKNVLVLEERPSRTHFARATAALESLDC